MPSSDKEKQIIEILKKIERSPLSAQDYIHRYEVPFSLAQYYRYKVKILAGGEAELKDKRLNEHSRKLKNAQVAFICEFVKKQPNFKLSDVKQVVEKEFNIVVHRSTISRLLKRLDIPVSQKQK